MRRGGGVQIKERGLSHPFKSLQGAQFPRQGPGQTFFLQISGGGVTAESARGISSMNTGAIDTVACLNRQHGRDAAF